MIAFVVALVLVAGLSSVYLANKGSIPGAAADKSITAPNFPERQQNKESGIPQIDRDGSPRAN
jgi:hypothetical protein